MRTLLILLLLAACVFLIRRLVDGDPPAQVEPVRRAPDANPEPSSEPSIPSYALRHIRPGPLVPDRMTPTILRATSATLREGSAPDN